MLAYFISQSNEYVFRTQPTASSQFTMSLQDMTTLQNFTASISGLTYESYESYVSFSLYISGAIVGEEYRATLSSADQPAHSSFIVASSGNYDWRSPQNINLWQGVNGVNNPCPSGYRLPTETEFNAERLSWSTNNAAGAFASPLKLPAAGFRDVNVTNGAILFAGAYGDYWSSSVNGVPSRRLFFDSSLANLSDYNRAYGFSVRCIKD